ncbi:MAG: aldo/keto reductase [Solobacterium sp.]|nr:aldo/keto reductase [Solobacterium sp.]
MEYKTLYNGVEMPMLGYGVYQIDPAETQRCVADAINIGYRLIDTAQAYGNEEGVGAAVAASGIDRSEFFLTSKIWITNGGYEKAAASIDESLQKLGTDYLDLMLIHQPYNDVYGTWRAMEDAYKAGKLRAIGLSNFYADRLIDFCTFAEIKPMINQVETHVFYQQKVLRAYADKLGVAVQSWGPFAEGRNNIFKDSLLLTFAERHSCTAAQVALRFLMQEGIVVIPKSVHAERMAENFDVFGFELTPGEMESMRSLDLEKSLFFNHEDPKTVEWFMESIRPKAIMPNDGELEQTD